MTVVAERGLTITDAQEALRTLGQATRKDLAEHLGCSRGVVTRLLDELVEAGLARHARSYEMTGKRGRPAPLFELKAERRPAAVELASGVCLDVKVDVRPMKGQGRDKSPVRGVTMEEIAPRQAPSKPRRRPVVSTTGGKIKRRKGKLGADELLRVAHELGFSVSRTKNGHLKFEKPGVPTQFSSSSPSDYRTVKNTIAQLRRANARLEHAA